MGFTPETMVRAGGRQVSARLGDEAVMLGLTSGKYFGLDGVGLLVWERLREPISVVDLQTAILAEYDVEPDRCFRDLCALLEALEGEDLIQRVATD